MVRTGSSTAEPATVAAMLPNFFRNEGVWQGSHRSIDLDGLTIALDERCTEILFPVGLDHHHVSRALSVDQAGGRTVIGEVRGRLSGDCLHWDEADFRGKAWDSIAGITLLEIVRKDRPGVAFRELITLSDCGDFRTRTLHWYRNGMVSHRTLCDERRVAR